MASAGATGRRTRTRNAGGQPTARRGPERFHGVWWFEFGQGQGGQEGGGVASGGSGEGGRCRKSAVRHSDGAAQTV